MEIAGKQDPSGAQEREFYEARLLEARKRFEEHRGEPTAGYSLTASRSDAVDEIVRAQWGRCVGDMVGTCLLATGGYGRRELFPGSDIDLLVVTKTRISDALKESVRRVNQSIWDCGLRAAIVTRSAAECGRFHSDNAEFTLALLDARCIAGDSAVSDRLLLDAIPKLIERDRKAICRQLYELTMSRHARYGGTIFHLEPNVKDVPGGLRDSHVCRWGERLSPEPTNLLDSHFEDGRAFLTTTRCFLHLLRGRDDNTLDWQAQDIAAAERLGMHGSSLPASHAAAYWMRLYFRHSRAVYRQTEQVLEALKQNEVKRGGVASLLRRPTNVKPLHESLELTGSRVSFRAFGRSSAVVRAKTGGIPAEEPESVMRLFEVVANTGARLLPATERQIEEALPALSLSMEDGPALWVLLRSILSGPFAGDALRAMHAVGLLELIVPEFHGIDTLVIRDAYHRYTVDEHTFVVLDVLHGLRAERPKQGTSRDVFSVRFSGLYRSLQHPELLLLGALLHDIGKGHLGQVGHAAESVRLAKGVLARLELDSYEVEIVLSLIGSHLEMSAALRRDIFDSETIRSFAEHARTPEALRMLTLFTYADISAVHPDALTPWKAENLWHLFVATSNYLDRTIDDERLVREELGRDGERFSRICAEAGADEAQVDQFLEGFPRRYLHMRTVEEIGVHYRMVQSAEVARGEPQVLLEYAFPVSRLTIVSRDRPLLFASAAGAIAAWGMNIVSADAFSNSNGIVIDTFRFDDPFKTLQLNETERDRFASDVHELLSRAEDVDDRLRRRRKSVKRRVPTQEIETRIEFDDSASAYSTVLQVVTGDTPGLLRTLAIVIAAKECNIEVALVDTEGEVAIDVFYLTRGRGKLSARDRSALRTALLEAITPARSTAAPVERDIQ